MTKTKKLQMELPKEGRFISSEFPILRDNLGKIDQAILTVEEKAEGKAPLQHTHTISEITDLESTLNGKMAADKTFTFADLSDIEGAKDAANNYVLYKSSNNNFTFGSPISLLGAHQHKLDDIVGMAIALQKIRDEITKEIKSFIPSPLEILMTESGIIPLPEGVTDDTDIEIWAWGGGGGGGSGSNRGVMFHGNGSGGGGGGGSARVQIKGSQLRISRNVQIGRGGKGGNASYSGGGAGGYTIIEGIICAGDAEGGGGGYGSNGSDGGINSNGSGGSGGRYYSSKTNVNGNSSTFGGGDGGSYAYYRESLGPIPGPRRENIGHGGNSIYGGAGGGCAAYNSKGGYSGKGGNGADGNDYTGGGGGGYFPGKSGDDGGDGGNGAILFKFFI